MMCFSSSTQVLLSGRGDTLFFSLLPPLKAFKVKLGWKLKDARCSKPPLIGITGFYDFSLRIETQPLGLLPPIDLPGNLHLPFPRGTIRSLIPFPCRVPLQIPVSNSVFPARSFFPRSPFDDPHNPLSNWRRSWFCPIFLDKGRGALSLSCHYAAMKSFGFLHLSLVRMSAGEVPPSFPPAPQKESFEQPMSADDYI